MNPAHGPSRATVRRLAALLGAVLLAPVAARAAPPGQALVIGMASYTGFPPIAACALSGHSVAAALRRNGFSVVEQTDASSGAIFAGIAELARHLKAAPQAPVVIYACSYVTSFNDRPFLLPVSAAISRPADVLTQGLLIKTLVDAVRTNTTAPAVIALDGIPLPNASGSLALDRLTADLPPTLGLIALRDTAGNVQPTPFAAMLVPALHGPELQSARLLADLKSQFAAVQTARIEALHMPSDGQDLVGGTAATAATAPAATASAATAPAWPTAPLPAAAPARAAAPVQPTAPAQGIAAGPAAPPAAAPPAASAAPPGVATALPDEDQMTDANRRAVQQALTKLGYYDGVVDGIFGPETRAAIRRWQHEVHVPMTGRLDTAEATRLVGG